MTDVELLKAIHPKKDGESDKFSWNVFRFFRKHKGLVDIFETNEGLILAKRGSQCDCCIITNGANWRSIRGGRLQEWSNMNLEKINVTDRFITSYIEGGVVWADKYGRDLREGRK